jgi:hypothetical protein
MKLAVWIFIFFTAQASAQIPRNNAGTFEYSHEISAGPVSDVLLKDRAKSFFNQPFLVHWTSISPDDTARGIFQGEGYLDIHVKNHYASKRAILVLLQLSIQIKEGSFRYTINRLSVNNKAAAISYPLEEKPETVESATYDRLLKKTHERISFVIDWLKRHMEDQAE